MDVEVDPGQLTPVIVARHWLEKNAAKRAACLIAEQSLEDLRGLELLTYPDQAETDAVIIGDLAGD